MSISRKLIEGASGSSDGGGGGSAGGVSDGVFSTYLYEGTGADLDIENGIDLEGEGGLVWIKRRDNSSLHILTDTERGPGKVLWANEGDYERDEPTFLNAFNSNGFSLGAGGDVNATGDYVSWTWRKAPKFFDIVTYTGDSTVGREIPHNLGCEPGMVIVKRTNGSSDWPVYHKDRGASQGKLNQNADFRWSYISGASDTTFTIADSGADTNQSGGEYLAYLFAHDESDDSLIKCGSYTGDTSSKLEIDLGFEPQWVMIKCATDAESWTILDSMRGIVADLSSSVYDPRLLADSGNAESNASSSNIDLTPSGFRLTNGDGATNATGREYLYMAIRRPSKPAEEFEPEELFAMFESDNPGNLGGLPGFRSGFPVDMAFWTTHRSSTSEKQIGDRLTQKSYFLTHETDAADKSAQANDFMFDYSNGYYADGNSAYFSWMWRRAPGFFDTTTYTGDGVAGRQVPHSLAAVPEMIWVKQRGFIDQWHVYTAATGSSLSLNLATDGAAQSGAPWNDTDPDEYTFTVDGRPGVNNNRNPVTAYLFASAPGISKVGSYAGTGAEIEVDCGFTAGARFVLIKRTDGEGDWYLWDTGRQNDAYLMLNNSDMQVLGTSYIAPLVSGFKVTASAPDGINASGGKYLFYAIA